MLLAAGEYRDASGLLAFVMVAFLTPTLSAEYAEEWGTLFYL